MPGETLRKLLTEGEPEPFSHGNTENETPDSYKGAGQNARGTGVSTRHAYGIEHEGDEAEAPQQRPGPAADPILGKRTANDEVADEHIDVVDFQPRHVTPPTVTPD